MGWPSKFLGGVPLQATPVVTPMTVDHIRPLKYGKVWRSNDLKGGQYSDFPRPAVFIAHVPRFLFNPVARNFFLHSLFVFLSCLVLSVVVLFCFVVAQQLYEEKGSFSIHIINRQSHHCLSQFQDTEFHGNDHFHYRVVAVLENLRNRNFVTRNFQGCLRRKVQILNVSN